MRPTLAWLFAPLALLGLLTFLPLVGWVVAAHVADIDLLEDEWGWTLIAIGWLGLAAALCFGVMALIPARPSGPAWARARRIGLGPLGILLLVVAGVQVLGSLVTVLA